MLTFNSNLCSVRRLDGSLATLSISPYPKILYEYVDKADFEKAIRLDDLSKKALYRLAWLQ